MIDKFTSISKPGGLPIFRVERGGIQITAVFVQPQRLLKGDQNPFRHPVPNALLADKVYDCDGKYQNASGHKEGLDAMA